MQPWDYLVFVPVLGAVYYLWKGQRSKTSCGACASCPTSKGCGSREERQRSG